MAVYSRRQGAQPTELHPLVIMSAKLVFLLAIIALCGLVTVSEAQYYGGYYGGYGLGSAYGYGGYGYGGYGYGGYGGYPYYGGYSYYGKRSAGFEPKN